MSAKAPLLARPDALAAARVLRRSVSAKAPLLARPDAPAAARVLRRSVSAKAPLLVRPDAPAAARVRRRSGSAKAPLLARSGALAAALVFLMAAPAAAHQPLADRDALWSAWSFNALVIANLAALALVYALGLRRLWRRAGTGAGVSRRQAASFAAGLLVLVLALLSPIDGLSEELQWVHMVQHMLLMNVAAPLIVLGAPLRASLWALPLPWRQRLGGALGRLDAWQPGGYLLGQAALTWAVYAFTLWVWHLPRFYQAALEAPLLHDLQHLSFFAASCLFWRALLDPLRRLALSPALAVLYLFTTSLHATLLGVFMALSPRVWYPLYTPRVTAWGLTPLEDQQLAGLIMWMPACTNYALIAALVFGLWLRTDPGERPLEA